MKQHGYLDHSDAVRFNSGMFAQPILLFKGKDAISIFIIAVLEIELCQRVIIVVFETRSWVLARNWTHVLCQYYLQC